MQFGPGWLSLEKGPRVPSSAGMSNSAPFVAVSSAVTYSRYLKQCGCSLGWSKDNSEIGWMQTAKSKQS